MPKKKSPRTPKHASLQSKKTRPHAPTHIQHPCSLPNSRSQSISNSSGTRPSLATSPHLVPRRRRPRTGNDVSPNLWRAPPSLCPTLLPSTTSTRSYNLDSADYIFDWCRRLFLRLAPSGASAAAAVRPSNDTFPSDQLSTGITHTDVWDYLFALCRE